MWITEEGRKGLSDYGFVRVFITPSDTDLYGDCEGKDDCGNEKYSIRIASNTPKLGDDVVNNKELIKHIKRIAV